jgi:hypothetical protein
MVVDHVPQTEAGSVQVRDLIGEPSDRVHGDTSVVEAFDHGAERRAVQSPDSLLRSEQNTEVAYAARYATQWYVCDRVDHWIDASSRPFSSRNAAVEPDRWIRL